MSSFELNPIGHVAVNEQGYFAILDAKYSEALRGLDEFGYVFILWWFSDCDNPTDRNILSMDHPYKIGPAKMGTLALRQPQRPNPIALSTAKIIKVDLARSIIQINYVDAIDGSPILDIKPYIPSLDWVEKPIIPNWCKHWPNSYEKSLDYDWKNEFTFYETEDITNE